MPMSSSSASKIGAQALSPARDIFSSIDRAPLIEDPYPHLVVEDALPKTIADTLIAEMRRSKSSRGGSRREATSAFACPRHVH